MAGDYLTFSTSHGQRKDPEVAGAVALRVPRGQLGTVDEHFDSLRILHVQFSPDYTTAAAQLEAMRLRTLRKIT